MRERTDLPNQQIAINPYTSQTVSRQKPRMVFMVRYYFNVLIYGVLSHLTVFPVLLISNKLYSLSDMRKVY